MTFDECLDKFHESFPYAEVDDYRPICYEMFQADKEDGMTIWLKNGDMVVYYPKRVEEKELPAVKVGDEVIVDGCKGIIIRDPYQIGRSDDPLILVLVWYGSHMGDAALKDVQPTGKTYPEVEQIIEQLKI